MRVAAFKEVALRHAAYPETTLQALVVVGLPLLLILNLFMGTWAWRFMCTWGWENMQGRTSPMDRRGKCPEEPEKAEQQFVTPELVSEVVPSGEPPRKQRPTRKLLWFYKVAGEESGPVSSGKLRRLALSGSISRDTYVRKGLEGNWVKAATVRGLFDPG
jgi:hypothetical protein